MVDKIGHVFLNNTFLVDDGVLLLMDGNNDINEAANEQLDLMSLLIHRCASSDF